MAQVPYSGAINISMWGGTTGASAESIREVLAYEFGYTGSNNWNNMIAYAKTSTIIENYRSEVRPASVGLLTSTNHFRGFPVVSSNIKTIYYQFQSPRFVDEELDHYTAWAVQGTDDGVLGATEGFQFKAYKAGSAGDTFSALALYWFSEPTEFIVYIANPAFRIGLFSPSFDGILTTVKVYAMSVLGVKGSQIGSTSEFFIEDTGSDQLLSGNYGKVLGIPTANIGSKGFYIEVIQIDADFNFPIVYNWQNSLFGTPIDNTVSATLEGTAVNQTDQTITGWDGKTFVRDISWVVTAADIAAISGGEAFLNIKFGTTAGGSNIATGSVSTTSAATLSLYSIMLASNFSSLSYGDSLHVEIEISDVGIV